MKVLSLFDGMSCGMLAMLEAGVKVDRYVAYEIDKYAVRTSSHNFPMIEQRGDVFQADFTEFAGFDLLVGGSPCTYWSIAQTKNRETVASGMGWELFSQYARALHEAKPKYFIYENNKSMSKAIRASIDETFGFEAVCINSALVSAQNRQRLYWVGKRNADGTYSKVNVEQPADRGILLKDVLDSAVAWRDKAHTIDSNYYKGGNFTSPNKQSGKRLMVAEPVCLRYERTEEAKRCRKAYEAHEIKHGYNELNELHPRPDGKTNTLTTVLKDNQIMEPVCVAERGRMYCGQPQHYEARTDGKTNTLTSVEKDNRVAEPVRGMENDTKSRTLTANYWKTNVRDAFVDCAGGRTMAAEPINVESYEISHTCDFDVTPSGTLRVAYTDKSESQGYRVYCADYKSVAMRAQGNGRGAELVAEPINDILQVGAMPRPDEEISTSAGFRIYSTEAKGRYLCANGGGAGAKTGLYAIPTMPVKEATSKGYTEIECGDCVDLSMPNSKTRRGRSMADKANCMQTSNDFYQYVAYAIEFDDDGKPIKAIGKDGKEITIYEVKGGKITIKGKQYPIKLKDGYYIIRKLTVSECKRLQTVPEWYEFPVSNSQAYKMLGNGWTVDVIAHILKGLKDAKKIPDINEPMCIPITNITFERRSDNETD